MSIMNTVAKILSWKGTMEHDLSMPIGIIQKLNGIARKKIGGGRLTYPLRLELKKHINTF